MPLVPLMRSTPQPDVLDEEGESISTTRDFLLPCAPSPGGCQL